MPDVTLTDFALEGKTPDQLEQRRRELVAKYVGGVSALADMTNDDLKELAALTAALRRRTTPTAKARKPGKGKGPKVSTDDLLAGL